MGIEKILIANRGEIALRIARTARAMGIPVVGVYSDADKDAFHTRHIQETVRIGPAPAAESYLNGQAILKAARETGADAIHPGYGFLAESGDFAESCLRAGLVFIGPPPEAIRAMADKSRAKARMMAANVPVVPGWQGTDQSPEHLQAQAERLGFPLLIKAVAGGGGRGMRQVTRAADFPEALAAATREARNAFGDGRVMLERFIPGGAHVEIQVFADAHGHVVHLFERDCSAQRRRQKIVEEAPSPHVTPELRARMGADAVVAAKAVGYVGAGTVEFLLDAQSNYYFLEMNTRLQVEHPATELVTGLDLVEWQIRVAEGARLPLTQEDIPLRGHAVEARLYAEDAYAGFAPATGRLAYVRPAEGLRADMGVETGSAVTPFYDNMIGKLIAHAPTREEAVAGLMAGLKASPMLGLATNQRFLMDLLGSAEFRAGRVTTATIDEWEAAGAAILKAPPVPEEAWGLAALLITERSGGDWFTTTGHVAFDLVLEAEGERRTFHIRRARDGTVYADDRPFRLLRAGKARVRYERGATAHKGVRVWLGDTLHLWVEGRDVAFREPDPFAAVTDAEQSGAVCAPFAGVLVRLAVQPGQRVAKGDTVAVLDAMKMEVKLAAPVDGMVAGVHAREGDQVAAGTVIAEIEREV